MSDPTPDPIMSTDAMGGMFPRVCAHCGEYGWMRGGTHCLNCGIDKEAEDRYDE